MTGTRQAAPTWRLPPGLLNTRTPLQVALIGVGGTGSELAGQLLQLHYGLRALGHAGLRLTAFDPDTVGAANIVRQCYEMADLGSNKAEALVSRLNLRGVAWRAVPERFGWEAGRQTWDVVASCVDSGAARAELHRLAHASGAFKWRMWLDCGNTHTTGQVVLGTPKTRGRAFLPCATELHPELMQHSPEDDEAPSCSAAEALTRQDLCVNKMVATLACDLLWRLFRTGELSAHARYFSLDGDRLAGRPVPRPEPARKRAGRSAAD